MTSEHKASYSIIEHIKEQRIESDVDLRIFLSVLRKLLVRRWFTLGLLSF